MRITAQELGSGIVAFKRELGAGHPRLALIGFANMFCDTSCFDDLFDVELRRYMVEHSNQLVPYVEQAARDGCVGIVGGDLVCETARRLGLPCKFTSSGEESIREALDTANRICTAIDQEKRNSAEMDAMLNYTFSGIMQVDRDGSVRRINRAGYDLLGKAPGELLGWPITQLLPNLSEKVLQDTPLPGQGGLRLPAGHQSQGGYRQHCPGGGGRRDRGRGAHLPGGPPHHRNGQRAAPGALPAGLHCQIQL